MYIELETFKIKTRYYLYFLMPEQWKYIEPMKRITKDQNCENVSYLETVEVVLDQCNIVNKDD